MWQSNLRYLLKKKTSGDILLQVYSNKLLRDLDTLIENISSTNLKLTIAKING